MTTWFTSDLHIGHARISELAGRPFTDVEQMNEVLVDNWNALVRPDDVAYVLGDVCMGKIDDSLKYISRLNGIKHLILGNHDRPLMQKSEEKRQEWQQRYLDAGFTSLHDSLVYIIGDYRFNLSHFPYDGDSHDGDRFNSLRLVDTGTPILHGHTHSKERVTFSSKGTTQIHVGVDAWGHSPVSMQAIIDLYDKHTQPTDDEVLRVAEKQADRWSKTLDILADS